MLHHVQLCLKVLSHVWNGYVAAKVIVKGCPLGYIEQLLTVETKRGDARILGLGG